MHHRSADPPSSARLTASPTRRGQLQPAAPRLPSGRLARAGLVTAAVTAVVLAVPVVSSGSGTDAPALRDSSSSTAAPQSSDAGSPVIIGVDGRPVPESSAGAAESKPTADTVVVPGAPGTTSDEDGATSATEPAPSSATARTARGSSGGSSEPSSDSTEPSSDSTEASSSTGSSAGPSSENSTAPVPPEPETPAPPTVAIPPVPTSATAPGDELLALLDSERDGCDPLTSAGSLAAKAQEHSAKMRDDDFFGLRGLGGGARDGEGGVAAYIARGETDAGDVLAGWLADPADRAIIVDCSRGSVGIGFADADGGDGPWWTLILA